MQNRTFRLFGVLAIGIFGGLALAGYAGASSDSNAIPATVMNSTASR